jgi:hypothetical protein
MTTLKFSKRLSIGFFVIGTSLFIAFAITLSPIVALIGFAYTGLAFTIGMVYFLVLGSKMGRQKLDAEAGRKSIEILALNVPIALIYFVLAMILINTARITLENTTGQDLSSLKISGCDDQEIELLKTGESKTIWIYIQDDCSVEIQYEIEGEIKKEVVNSYSTSFSGQIATYKIGSN